MLILLMLAVVQAAAARLPAWTAPLPNASLPYDGYTPLPRTSHYQVYNASSEPTGLGTYNHIPMVSFLAPRLLLSWTNAPRDEGQPGSRVLYSQSADGAVWTPPAVLFPNMSSHAADCLLSCVILIAEPAVVLGGDRLYAVASLLQFELYPAQHPMYMLLRRVYAEPAGALGPIFWATEAVPPAAAVGSAALNVSLPSGMDATTRGDLAALLNASGYTAAALPCAPVAAGSPKCEACAGGCQAWADIPKALGLANERTHYTLPPGDDRVAAPDVLLYRSFNGTAWASVRTAAGGDWPLPADTRMPNAANLNAGALPDGRRFLLLNTGPGRDPLALALTTDGWAWDACRAVVSCADLAPGRAACMRRHAGYSTGTGVAYPQGAVITTGAAVPPALANTLVVAYSNNKEDMWVSLVPLDAITGS